MAKSAKFNPKGVEKRYSWHAGLHRGSGGQQRPKITKKKTWVGSSLAQCAGAVGGEKGGVDESTPAGLGQELDKRSTRRQGAADLIAPRIPPGQH